MVRDSNKIQNYNTVDLDTMGINVQKIDLASKVPENKVEKVVLPPETHHV